MKGDEAMIVYIRGAGDLASGIALRLYRCGIRVVMADLAEPTSIRRTVSFSEAIRLGETKVEEVRALLAANSAEALALTKRGLIAVLVDPKAEELASVRPDALVDAIIAKRNLGTKITDAPVVIGVGPGFCAGEDCHAAVETKRGHTLGRVIYDGSPLPNTGIPGAVCGVTLERVMYAPCAGSIRLCRDIGDIVEAGDIVATVADEPRRFAIGGTIRGLIQDGARVKAGMKCGDVDPRGAEADYLHVSDKSLAVGGGE